MSGIVGLVHADGAPADSELLRKLAEFLGFRGPDAQKIWIGGNVGFGHTLLRTAPESAHERQPLSLDGETWIVCDARVDARQDLRAELRAHGQEDLVDAAPDAELILRAYHVWDEQCVDHLLGDFVFAVWDARRRRLFCARDQMGVKPFFYAHLGPLFLFSNTLDCLRRHPAVSGKLNELAIADFLLFDANQDPTTTSFEEIHRLPAAHSLTYDAGRVSVRRYWELAVTTPISFRRDEEYLERFRELLDDAVADRLRADSVGVLMSGGLDSPTVAAGAKRVLTRRGGKNGLSACTEVFDSLIPHEERRYAGLVAEGLKIPIEFHACDDASLFGDAREPDYHSPEPEHCAWPDGGSRQLRQVALRSRVALTGFGADPALSCRITVHFRELLNNGRYGRVIADAARYLMTENRLSRLYLRTRWRLFRKPQSAAASYPVWLNQDMEKRLGLRDRWRAGSGVEKSPKGVRPEALYFTAQPFWQQLFECYDAGVTSVPIDVAHPFFDLRLLRFLSALPRLPWCSDKQILRDAARGVLPESVRLRRKSPLAADPLVALLDQPESAWVDRFSPAPELDAYVSRERVPAVYREKNSWAAWVHLRPLSLHSWFVSERSSNMADREGSDAFKSVGAGARS